MKRDEYLCARKKAEDMIRAAGIAVSASEIRDMDVTDFGLGDLCKEGGQMVTLFNTERISAKIIALFPGQTLPEHWHNPVGSDPGKEEIIRVASGKIYFYTEGGPSEDLPRYPAGKEAYYTCRKEAEMLPGHQIHMNPGEKHWFCAGDEGAVLYSFSTNAKDNLDSFSDPGVIRETVITD